MGDILDMIKERRTIKRFTGKYVSWEKVAKILDAGRHAPSSGNIQNWKFIVSYDPGQKHDLAKACYDQLDIAQASVLIVVCAEIDKAVRYYGLRGERLYAVQNCAAAMQNMILEAQSLGLGTAWIGAFDEDQIKGILGIPQDVRPQGIVAVGYADAVPARPPKYPLETLTYFGGWRSKIRDPAKYMNDISTLLARKAKSATEMAKEVAQGLKQKAQESKKER